MADKTLKGSDIVRQTKEQLCDLTGLKAETVSGMTREDDHWKVILELIELARIPTAQDVMGTYVCTVDTAGNLIGYNRTRRYLRGSTDTHEEGA
jgi:hypothetical protein